MSPWEGAEYILPGDEKAQPEAPGAPTPLKADEIAKAAPKTATPPPTPKTTEGTAQTRRQAGAPIPRASGARCATISARAAEARLRSHAGTQSGRLVRRPYAGDE